MGRKSWDAYYRELQDCLEETGELPSEHAFFKPVAELGTWMKTQRRLYKVGKLPKEKERRLSKLHVRILMEEENEEVDEDDIVEVIEPPPPTAGAAAAAAVASRKHFDTNRDPQPQQQRKRLRKDHSPESPPNQEATQGKNQDISSEPLDFFITGFEVKGRRFDEKELSDWLLPFGSVVEFKSSRKRKCEVIQFRLRHTESAAIILHHLHASSIGSSLFASMTSFPVLQQQQ